MSNRSWTVGLAGLGYVALPGDAAAQPSTNQQWRAEECDVCEQGTSQEMAEAFYTIANAASTLNGGSWYLEGKSQPRFVRLSEVSV